MGEDALHQGVVAGVHVADHREVVARRDRRLVGGRDLHVDGLKDGRCARPARWSEKIVAARAPTVAGSGSASSAAMLPLQLGGLGGELGRQRS